MELSDSPSPPQILLRVLKPDQFQGVAIWEHSYDMENWLAYHADSLMPTNRALVENKRYSQNRRLLQSHFFRTRFLRRSPQIQTNWLVHIENTSPQNLQNVALTVLSMGNDAPLVVQMGFWVRPNCTFYNWAPPSCNPSYGLTTLEFTAAGWDSMRVERLANLTVSQGASEYFLLRITCRSTLKPTR